MSMRAVPWPDPDPVVAAAIRVKYAGRRVPLAVAVRDRLGQWMADELFAAAFGVRGRPGWPPSRLAVVTVLQMAEDLTGRVPGLARGPVLPAGLDRRYGTPVTTWRRPAPGKAERDKLAGEYARDGYALVAACYEESAPPWLREIPAVRVLRTVLIQSFTRTVSEGGREVISRGNPAAAATGSRPPIESSPVLMTPMSAGAARRT
jgi:hypothetical protein